MPGQPPSDLPIEDLAPAVGGKDDAVRTVSFVSLGCPKNLVDSERMLGMLAESGISPVSTDADRPAVETAESSPVAATVAGEDLSLAGSEQDTTAAIDITPADAVVINTCGFLEASKAESMATIDAAVAAKERGEVKRVVVAGCLVQRHRAKILDWAPGVDAMLGVFDRDKVVEAVTGMSDAVRTRNANVPTEEDSPKYWVTGNALLKARREGLAPASLTVNGGPRSVSDGLGYFESDRGRLRLTPRHYSYLRISEGCNQRCAFCTIPSIRGKMRSKREGDVVAEARELLRDGAYELLLIGQDTTSYGDDIGVGLGQTGESGRFAEGLPRLLDRLDTAAAEEVGRCWLRLMYAYPTTFTEPVIDAFAEIAGRGRLVPYIDIPLQHGSDAMLTAMRRNVSAAQQLELVEMLREKIPGMAIRTTFISGFPGETEADHEELLGFIERAQFDAVGVFGFSPEPGTPAAKMAEDASLRVPEDVIQRRREEVLGLQQELAFEQAEYLAEQFDETKPTETGCRFDVLIDERAGEAAERGPFGGRHIAKGRTYFQAPKIDAVTYVLSREPLTPGELVPCTITASDGYDLVATPVVDLERRVPLSVLSG